MEPNLIDILSKSNINEI